MLDILKIIFILIALLLLIRKKWDLGFVLFIGTVLMGLLFKIKIEVFAQSILQALISEETLSLVGIMLLVLYLGNLLQTSGNFKKMVESLENLIPEPRLILALPPSFIGLLPMIGGALMSAPIVAEAAKKWNISSAWKTFLNYWFRHIWEYCWPLYLNLIIAAAIIQVPIIKIASVQFPFTLLAACLGMVILFKYVPPLPKERRDGNFFRNLFNLFFSIWPIVLIILLVFICKLSMLLALAVVVLLTQLFFRMNFQDRIKVIWKSLSIKMIVLMVSIMVFKRILEISGALDSITQAVHSEGLSGIFLLFIVPFFLGLLTGVNQAFVSISFPLLIPIFGQGNPDMVLVMFAYVSGFVGILLSPAHLCLALTVEYFQADIRDVYKILVWPASIVFLAAFLALLFLRII